MACCAALMLCAESRCGMLGPSVSDYEKLLHHALSAPASAPHASSADLVWLWGCPSVAGGKLEPLSLCLAPAGPSSVRCLLLPSSAMQAGDRFLSDGEYNTMWSSLQQQENHVCTRQVRRAWFVQPKLHGGGPASGTARDHRRRRLALVQQWPRPCVCLAGSSGANEPAIPPSHRLSAVRVQAGVWQHVLLRDERPGPRVRPKLQPADLL